MGLSALSREHRAYKERMVEKMHRWADLCNHCHDFDRLMVQCGLPGRPRFYVNYSSWDRPKIVGERTEERFQKWLRQTSIKAHRLARENGYTSLPMERVFAEAGVLPYKDLFRTADLEITGAFSVSMQIDIAVGEPIDVHVSSSRLLTELRRQANNGELKYLVQEIART